MMMVVMMVVMMLTIFVTIMIMGLDVLFLNPWRRPEAKGKCSKAMMPLTLKSRISGQSSMSLSKMDLFRDGGNYVLEPRAHMHVKDSNEIFIKMFPPIFEIDINPSQHPANKSTQETVLRD